MNTNKDINYWQCESCGRINRVSSQSSCKCSKSALSYNHFDNTYVMSCATFVPDHLVNMIYEYIKTINHLNKTYHVEWRDLNVEEDDLFKLFRVVESVKELMQ